MPAPDYRLHTKKDGSFNEVKNLYVKSGGVWKQVIRAYIKWNEVWEQFYAIIPDAPTNFNATNSRYDDRIRVSWQQIDDLKYFVYEHMGGSSYNLIQGDIISHYYHWYPGDTAVHSLVVMARQWADSDYSSSDVGKVSPTSGHCECDMACDCMWFDECECEYGIDCDDCFYECETWDYWDECHCVCDPCDCECDCEDCDCEGDCECSDCWEDCEECDCWIECEYDCSEQCIPDPPDCWEDCDCGENCHCHCPAGDCGYPPCYPSHPWDVY